MMLKVIFYIKSATSKVNGENPIYARISNECDSIVLSTGKSITVERWKSTNKLRNVLKQEREKVLKQSLENLRLLIETKYAELYRMRQDFTLSDLKDSITAKKKVAVNEMDILKLFDEHNAHFLRKVNAGDRSRASHQKYECSKKELIRAFIIKKYGVDKLGISKVNSAFVYNLEEFLKYESNFKDKIGIGNNSVVKYFSNFKSVCNYGIKMALIEKNPFDIFDGKVCTTDAVFLSDRELQQIEKKQFTIERLQKVKDIFLFSCYTGYAPVDAESLTERPAYRWRRKYLDNCRPDKNGHQGKCASVAKSKDYFR